MEKQYISGKETKKHIGAALKEVFPGMKFSLTSDFDSVNVTWTDGPIALDVEKVLNRFASYTRILAFDDRDEATGYEWNGGLYVGAKYLNTIRRLTVERRAALIAYMDEAGGITFVDALVMERANAERMMIADGLLLGSPPEDRPDLMRNQRPTEDRRVKKTSSNPALVVDTSDSRPETDAPPEPEKWPDNVVELFPRKTVEQEVLESLTPEQRLKLQVIQIMFKTDFLQLSGMTVDEAFAFVADELYGASRRN